MQLQLLNRIWSKHEITPQSQGMGYSSSRVQGKTQNRLPRRLTSENPKSQPLISGSTLESVAARARATGRARRAHAPAPSLTA
ncbi:hypothetical protein POUND7_012706 [Theobroma cacao]